jgi:hypothetical protein
LNTTRADTIVAASAFTIAFVNVIHAAARAPICDRGAGSAILALYGTAPAGAPVRFAFSLLKFGCTDGVAFDEAIAANHPGVWNGCGIGDDEDHREGEELLENIHRGISEI